LPSARQLVWLALVTIASGVVLLVPLFVGGDGASSRLLGPVRHLHSAASLLLAVGGLAHGLLRLGHAVTTRRGVATGILASTSVGLAALTGAMIADPRWWSERLGLGQDELRHVAGVMHYGYCGALVFGLVVWHARPAGRILPSFDVGTLLNVVILPIVAVLVAPGRASPSPYTIALVPPILVLAAWTLLAPQLAWAWFARGKVRAPEAQTGPPSNEATRPRNPRAPPGPD
jgi:hypothetical protein